VPARQVRYTFPRSVTKLEEKFVTSVSSSISEQVAARLAPYIGHFNAQMWIKSVARRDLKLSPEELSAAHLARLAEGLRPFLQTLMGRATAEDLLLQISREVR
jgi:hypothetical protein